MYLNLTNNQFNIHCNTQSVIHEPNVKCKSKTCNTQKKIKTKNPSTTLKKAIKSQREQEKRNRELQK